jgi:hypothetical protein
MPTDAISWNQLKLALEILRAEFEQVRVAVNEMNELRVKFHTEHMLDKADSDRFDQLLDIVVMILEGEED